MDSTRLDIWSNRLVSDALREYIEHKVELALNRFDHPVDRVQVRLEDGERPAWRDGQALSPSGHRPAFVAHSRGGRWGNVYDAVDAAAARARRSVGQLLARLAEQRKEAVA